jgi:hypothetical protein
MRYTEEDFEYERYCASCERNTTHIRGVCRPCVDREKAVQIELFQERIREAEGLGDPEE